MGWFENTQDESEDIELQIDQTRLKTELEEAKYHQALLKAQTKELKKRYGKDWKRALGNIRDSETLNQLANIGKRHAESSGGLGRKGLVGGPDTYSRIKRGCVYEAETF